MGGLENSPSGDQSRCGASHVPGNFDKLISNEKSANLDALIFLTLIYLSLKVMFGMFKA